MQAKITIPFEELQQQWKEGNAPVFIRRTNRKDWVTIIKKPSATEEEFEIFMFGHHLPKVPNDLSIGLV